MRDDINMCVNLISSACVHAGYQGKMPSPSSERSAPSFGHHSELEGLRAPARDPEDPPP